MTENEISYIVRGCIFEVYNTLGPGLLESVYNRALCLELSLQNLKFRREVPVIPVYKGHELDIGFKMDIVVEEKVMIETKSIEVILPLHHLKALNHIRIAGLKLGILVNFNTANISDSIYRKVNKL